EIEEQITSGIKDPRCNICSGILKPDTISFGQAMPEDKVSEAIMYAHRCDLCIVMGSSLVVYPAASIPEEAVNSGARLIIINRDETPLDDKSDLLIHDSVGKVLSRIISEILK
ncbi:MAG: sigma factor regulator FecR, partial [Deltaproteobacteria bacterium]|nr:sigma factor regulator FecR [Deltaproteobacteria bacterium]